MEEGGEVSCDYIEFQQYQPDRKWFLKDCLGSTGSGFTIDSKSGIVAWIGEECDVYYTFLDKIRNSSGEIEGQFFSTVPKCFKLALNNLWLGAANEDQIHFWSTKDLTLAKEKEGKLDSQIIKATEEILDLHLGDDDSLFWLDGETLYKKDLSKDDSCSLSIKISGAVAIAAFESLLWCVVSDGSVVAISLKNGQKKHFFLDLPKSIHLDDIKPYIVSILALESKYILVAIRNYLLAGRIIEKAENDLPQSIEWNYFADPCRSNGPDEEDEHPGLVLTSLPKWDKTLGPLVMIADPYSPDIACGAILYDEDADGKFNILFLECEEGLAQMPLNKDGDDTLPLAMAWDFADCQPLTYQGPAVSSGEKVTLPSAPIIWIVNNEYQLVAFRVVRTDTTNSHPLMLHKSDIPEVQFALKKKECKEDKSTLDDGKDKKGITDSGTTSVLEEEETALLLGPILPTITLLTEDFGPHQNAVCQEALNIYNRFNDDLDRTRVLAEDIQRRLLRGREQAINDLPVQTDELYKTSIELDGWMAKLTKIETKISEITMQARLLQGLQHTNVEWDLLVMDLQQCLEDVPLTNRKGVSRKLTEALAMIANRTPSRVKDTFINEQKWKNFHQRFRNRASSSVITRSSTQNKASLTLSTLSMPPAPIPPKETVPIKLSPIKIPDRSRQLAPLLAAKADAQQALDAAFVVPEAKETIKMSPSPSSSVVRTEKPLGQATSLARSTVTTQLIVESKPGIPVTQQKPTIDQKTSTKDMQSHGFVLQKSALSPSVTPSVMFMKLEEESIKQKAKDTPKEEYRQEKDKSKETSPKESGQKLKEETEQKKDVLERKETPPPTLELDTSSISEMKSPTPKGICGSVAGIAKSPPSSSMSPVESSASSLGFSGLNVANESMTSVEREGSLMSFETKELAATGPSVFALPTTVKDVNPPSTNVANKEGNSISSTTPSLLFGFRPSPLEPITSPIIRQDMEKTATAPFGSLQSLGSATMTPSSNVFSSLTGQSTIDNSKPLTNVPAFGQSTSFGASSGFGQPSTLGGIRPFGTSVTSTFGSTSGSGVGFASFAAPSGASMASGNMFSVFGAATKTEGSTAPASSIFGPATATKQDDKKNLPASFTQFRS